MHAYGGTRGWREIIVVTALAGCGAGGGGETDGLDSGGSDTVSSGDVADPTTTTTTGTSTGEPTTTTASTDTGEPPTGTGEPTTGTTDASSSSGEETGPPVEEGVPVFLAQGHYGRTTISCDDGKTWIQNKSQDDAALCFQGDLDCDHDAYAGRGIAWGDGEVVLTWGWGAPGTLVRSDDAATFTPVLEMTPTFADVAYGNGRFVANASPTRISDDGGLTWSEGGPLDIDINTRAIEFIPQGGGRFIVTGESGEDRAIVHSPDGVTWTAASDRPPACGGSVIGIGHGDDVTIVVSGKGHVCRSTDAGDTWTQVVVSDSFSSPPVWTGSEFYVYQGNQLHRSATGETWKTEALTPGDVSIGQVVRSPEGTFVAANEGWQQWYEKQRFFRSTDGKAWEQLPAGAFVGSHPINFMAHGRVTAGAGCPAN